MSDSNEQKKGIGKDVALVLLTLGGVGGYLWLDHKLRLERKTNSDLTAVVLRLAALQAPQLPPGRPVSLDVLPKELRTQLLALPGATPPTSPSRNATSLARLPRIELAPRTYDDVFANHGRGIPAAYLRALALHESDMRPRLSDGPAWGLLQVIEVVREDYNKRERSNFTRQDLLDAAVNVMIGASLLAVIIKSYAANHPSSPNMQTNWRNPQFVALVTFGWNAGWSERGGVGRVASFLEQRGADVTINSVFDAAKAAGASPHLCNPMKLAFAKQVTRQYFAELADEERVIEIEDPRKRATSDRPAVVVEAPSSPTAPVSAPDEIPVVIVETPEPRPEDSRGPITSPSQLEPEPPVVVVPPMEYAEAIVSPMAPPAAAPAMPPIAVPTMPPTAAPAMPPIVVPPTAAPAMPPTAAPAMPPTAVPAMPPAAAPMMPVYPSGGAGPIDPYEETAEPYGYPEDPYAYLYSLGTAPHA